MERRGRGETARACDIGRVPRIKTAKYLQSKDWNLKIECYCAEDPRAYIPVYCTTDIDLQVSEEALLSFLKKKKILTHSPSFSDVSADTIESVRPSTPLSKRPTPNAPRQTLQSPHKRSPLSLPYSIRFTPAQPSLRLTRSQPSRR